MLMNFSHSQYVFGFGFILDFITAKLAAVVTAVALGTIAVDFLLV